MAAYYGNILCSQINYVYDKLVTIWTAVQTNLAHILHDCKEGRWNFNNKCVYISLGFH